MAIRTVIRILEYTGPEEWLEATFAANRVPLQGERRIGPLSVIKSGTVRWAREGAGAAEAELVDEAPPLQDGASPTDLEVIAESPVRARDHREPLRLPRPGGG